MTMRKIAAAMFGATVIAVLALAPASAQSPDWPAKPVRIVTGFAAGGIGDLGARLLAEHITRITGQQAVVENRTGAAGSLGMDAVAKAAPDGATLGLALNGNLVINPFIQKSMPFDPLKDLIPVAMIGDAPQLIAINAEVPARCRTCRGPSSPTWRASRWCTCPIAATPRRSPTCSAAASAWCRARSAASARGSRRKKSGCC
jgi:hypothetical protein